jgi:hypothetical protein
MLVGNFDNKLYFSELLMLALLSTLSNLRNKLQSTSILPNLAHLADLANCALELRLILAAIERTGLEGAAAVDGRVGCGTDVKFGEMIELDFVRVVGVALARCLDLLCL